MDKAISIEKAMLYEKYRLPYPNSMIDDLFDHIKIADVIADIGAGTGQLTRLVADRCDTIYTVEPDSSMVEVAIENFRNYPNVHVINAFAEQTTLSSNSIDLILLGNAFHRFKAPAINELLRILKPQGWVALMSFRFTNQSFADLLFGKLSEVKSLTAREEKNWHMLSVDNLFGDNQIHTLTYTQAMEEDWDTFWGSARSGIEAPESHHEDFAQFKAINQEVFDKLSVDNHIRKDYETKVLFGQPKP